jgi:hypothetical protein
MLILFLCEWMSLHFGSNPSTTNLMTSMLRSNGKLEILAI